MNTEPRLDMIGAALADPSRTRILCTLMDGRAFTNKELAAAAGISPPTASAHLRTLFAAGLTTSVKSGRCQYHRIASEAVAETLERLAHLTPCEHLLRHPKAAERIRAARSCYNHIAGRLGVEIAVSLVAQRVITLANEAATPGPAFRSFLAASGLVLPDVPQGKPVVKPCLDWTERHIHLSGPFGNALLGHALSKNWLAREQTGRALCVTPSGKAAFAKLLPAPDTA